MSKQTRPDFRIHIDFTTDKQFVLPFIRKVPMTSPNQLLCLH